MQMTLGTSLRAACACHGVTRNPVELRYNRNDNAPFKAIHTRKSTLLTIFGASVTRLRLVAFSYLECFAVMTLLGNFS